MELDLTNKHSPPPWGWPAAVSTLILCVVGGIVLALGLSLGARALGLPVGEGLASPVPFIAGASIYLLAILGVYLFAARRTGWAALGVRGAPLEEFLLVVPAFMFGTVALLAVNLAITALQGSFDNPQAQAITGGEALGPVQFVMAFVLVAIIAPIAEELYFRGMLYPLLRGRLAAPLAIGANALIFSVAHFIPLLMPGLFVAGLMMAYLRERSGSIWPSVCYHMLQNGLALTAIAVATAQGVV